MSKNKLIILEIDLSKHPETLKKLKQYDSDLRDFEDFATRELGEKVQIDKNENYYLNGKRLRVNSREHSIVQNIAVRNKSVCIPRFHPIVYSLWNKDQLNELGELIDYYCYMPNMETYDLKNKTLKLYMSTSKSGYEKVTTFLNSTLCIIKKEEFEYRYKKEMYEIMREELSNDR